MSCLHAIRQLQQHAEHVMHSLGLTIHAGLAVQVWFLTGLPMVLYTGMVWQGPSHGPAS